MKKLLFIIIAFIVTINSCKKDFEVPVVTITEVYDITSTTATSGGIIISDGEATVTSRGVCWSINQNPTTTDKKTTDGTGFGSYMSLITGLTRLTTFYFRAYATNAIGTAYGNQITVVTTADLPEIKTTNLSVNTATTATGSIDITSDGGANVT